ncbi:MAG: metallophosphoesterase [Candidatus Zixiibacteriota bacterium]
MRLPNVNLSRIIVLFFIILSGGFCPAVEKQTLNQNVDSTIAPVFADSAMDVMPVNYNDGPHVYWHNDTLATVIYLCDSVLDKFDIAATDTLRFYGLCWDGETEYKIPVGEHQVPPCEYQNVSKIFAISDIHGEYESLVDILINAGVIDDDLRWSWGEGHLVFNGDIFDRGDKVTECLWLIYRLEQEAIQAEGAVHFILGNHELMVLRGDNRYVNEKYLDGIVKRTRISHEDLFGPDMELGRWLRSKNTVEKINGILFVHGGLSPYVAAKEYSLLEINDAVRRSLDLRSSQLAFDSEAQLLFKSRGPFWYRGFFYGVEDDYPQITGVGVSSILSQYSADAIVVGHSEIDSVSALYENRIYGIDVSLEDLGHYEALLWQDGVFYRVEEDGELRPIE